MRQTFFGDINFERTAKQSSGDTNQTISHTNPNSREWIQIEKLRHREMMVFFLGILTVSKQQNQNQKPTNKGLGPMHLTLNYKIYQNLKGAKSFEKKKEAIMRTKTIPVPVAHCS